MNMDSMSVIPSHSNVCFHVCFHDYSRSHLYWCTYSGRQANTSELNVSLSVFSGLDVGAKCSKIPNQSK